MGADSVCVCVCVRVCVRGMEVGVTDCDWPVVRRGSFVVSFSI